MGIKSFVAGVAAEAAMKVIQDPKTAKFVEDTLAGIVTKYVTPLIPVAISAAVDKVVAVLDVDKDGDLDVADVTKAATDTVADLLPPWLKPFLPKF